MDLRSSSLIEIRNMRKQKLGELLFPSFGTGHERLLYGCNVTSFVENNEQIGYYIHKNSEVLDFYVKKEFDTLADDCFLLILKEIERPVFTIRSDDSLLINMVFNYFIELKKGDYLFVRDRRYDLPQDKDGTLTFSPLSLENFEDGWQVISQEESFFYNGCDPSQKEMFKSFIGKDIFHCLSDDVKVRGVGYHQVVRNNCAEVGLIIDKEARNQGYGTLLLSNLTRVIENKNYKCFAELPQNHFTGRKLMEKLGFYVIAKYFIATIKGKVDENNIKKRSRRYSLSGTFRVL